MPEESELDAGAESFVLAFLDRDENALDKAVVQLGVWRSTALMIALIAVLLNHRIGPDVTMESVSGYSRSLLPELDKGFRPMVVELVLRVAVGFEKNLAGIPEEEFLDCAAAVLRRMCRDLVTADSGRREIIERVVAVGRDLPR